MKLIPRSVLALSAALPLTLALAGEAHAGTLQVRDDVYVLTPADEAALRAQVDAQPFDVRVWTTDTALDRAAFDARVARLVASQRMVVIAVDPSHHRTSVHFRHRRGRPPRALRGDRRRGRRFVPRGAVARGRLGDHRRHARTPR